MGRPSKETFDRPKPKISWNLSRGAGEERAPDLGTAGEVVQALGALAPLQPGRDDSRQRHDRDRGDRACGGEELADPGLGHDQAHAGDQDARDQRDQGCPGMGEDQEGHRHDHYERRGPAA